jgi:glucose/arabinose dehydrogenase
VPSVRSTGGEQGLLGIVVDPGFPARPYLYVHYDYSGSATIRISRYTVAGDLGFTGDGSLTIDPLTRYDILTDIPDNASNHNGGTLRFGPDGMLYDSIGDDASSCQAQSLTVLAGKILRLNVSGLPSGGGGPPAKSLITPVDNPYVSNPNANASRSTRRAGRS